MDDQTPRSVPQQTNRPEEPIQPGSVPPYPQEMSETPTSSGAWKAGGTVYTYTAPPAPREQTPYQGNAPEGNSTPQGVPVPPSVPRSPYSPPNAYNPYGQAPLSFTPPPKPPKKRGTGVLVAILSLICVASVVTLSVLLAMSWNGSGLPNTSSSSSGGVGGLSSNIPDGSSPPLDVSQITAPESWITGVCAKAAKFTVMLTMYYNGQAAGGATGIVWTQDGYILTNAHCVLYNENTKTPYTRIDVKFYDGTVLSTTEICGYDTSTDLAVIKVDADNLTPADFADASDVQLGDYVVTLGNAAGLEWSTSLGIISGLNRDVYDDTGFSIPCLQVDAAINPGNSGGPLLNAAGQVIGINSAKIVLEGYENLGFSVPINSESQRIFTELVKYGRVTGRVSLGIGGQTSTSLNYEGFRIVKIYEGSDMQGKARVGDIITHINGVRVMSHKDLRTELVKNSVGDTVTLTLVRIDNYSRKETTFTISVKLIEDTN